MCAALLYAFAMDFYHSFPPQSIKTSSFDSSIEAESDSVSGSSIKRKRGRPRSATIDKVDYHGRKSCSKCNEVKSIRKGTVCASCIRENMKNKRKAIANNECPSASVRKRFKSLYAVDSFKQKQSDFELAMNIATPIQTRAKPIEKTEIVKEQAKQFLGVINEETAKINQLIRVKAHQLKCKQKKIDEYFKAEKKLKKYEHKAEKQEELQELFEPLKNVIKKKRKKMNYNTYSKSYSSYFFYLLFKQFISTKRCTQKQAAQYFLIPPSTLSSRYNTWCEFEKSLVGTKERRGRKCKLNTDQIEKLKHIIHSRIHSHEITQNKHVPALVQSIAPSVLKFSESSIGRYKKRMNICSRSTKVVQHRMASHLTEKQRTTKEWTKMTEILHYLEDVAEALAEYGADNVYNMDEKPLSGAPSTVVSFQIIGEESEKLHSIGSPNRIMTAVVTVSASGRKLPILFLKKGKSKTCISYKAITNNVSLFSNELDLTPKGWMNEIAMLKYLHLFSANVPQKRCALIVDQYGSHKTDAVLKLAEELKIKLILVPKKHTDELQPLDVGVFGDLQSMTNADWETEDTAIDYMNHFQKQFQDFPASKIQAAFCAALDVTEEELNISAPSAAVSAINSINSSLQYAFSDLQRSALSKVNSH